MTKRGRNTHKRRWQTPKRGAGKHQRGAAQAPKRGGLPKPLRGRGCQIGYSGLWWEFGVLGLLKEIRNIL